MAYQTTTNESLSVTFDDGSTHTLLHTDPEFGRACELAEAEQWEELKALMSTDNKMAAWARDAGFSITDNWVCYRGDRVPPSLSSRIMDMMDRGLSVEPMFRFFAHLSENPSYRSVQQLHSFLKHCGIPVTEDGTLMVYKSVRRDYYDHHSGTLENKPGAELDYPRNKISDDPRVACHTGLHVGALEYAQGFRSGSSRIIIVEVNPRDVVCVPYDHSEQKMRVCKYKVIGNWSGQQLEDVYHEPEDSTVTDESPSIKVKTSKPTSKITAAEWAYLDDLPHDEDTLLKQNLQHLRRWARNDLKIVGASKLRGGKPALVLRILEVLKD